MTDNKLPNYDDFDYLLQQNKLASSASEVHGILCGCICGGMNEISREWLSIFSDFCMDGEEIPNELLNQLILLFKLSFNQFKEGQLAYEIFLPEDDIPLEERAGALVEWINGFISAIGLQKISLQSADEEIKEAFQDLISISKMETDLDDSEENLQAFEEIVEYIRVSSILCFTEFAKIQEAQAPSSPTLH
jgi:uncharacterized protein YgfB (UPF0149 family)